MCDDIESLRRRIRTLDSPASSYAHSEYLNARALLVTYRVWRRLLAGEGATKSLDQLIGQERRAAVGLHISTKMLDAAWRAACGGDKERPRRGRGK